MIRILPLLICSFFSSFLYSRTPAVQASDVITIPVVVHVLYNTAIQNISDAQINSQLVVLNKDFRGINDDRNKIPSYFASLAADAGFEFRLATVDARGYATSGIIRKQTSIQMFGVDDRIKNALRGGDDAWDSNKYLNIWVGNLAGGILGYTSTTGGPAEKDGVVIQYSAFGTMETASAPFNLGRTATHEIGHWLNLLHIWGDAYCGDDQVEDTPKQRSSNRGLPTGEKFSCEVNAHGDMYMNFMDLTSDAGMYMFTKGQRQRMRNTFEPGGSRYKMLASEALRISTLKAPAEIAATPVVAAKMNVYPNPASSNLTIELNGTDITAVQSIVIFNYLGNPVITQTIQGKTARINIAGLTNGVYFIKTANGLVTKFVKD